MPDRAPPSTTSGACPSVMPIRAPIWPRGIAMRLMGRGVSESSPTRVLVNGRPARRPARSRIVVPELPQSSGPTGSTRPSRPRPWTNRLGTPSAPSTSSRSSNSTPRARRQATVDCGSAASENPTISLSPSARAAKRAARWATDLSAGSDGVPASAAAGWTVTIMGSRCRSRVGGPCPGGANGGVLSQSPIHPARRCSSAPHGRGSVIRGGRRVSSPNTSRASPQATAPRRTPRGRAPARPRPRRWPAGGTWRRCRSRRGPRSW